MTDNTENPQKQKANLIKQPKAKPEARPEADAATPARPSLPRTMKDPERRRRLSS